MGRKKSFNTDIVLEQIGQLFISQGYNGTSVDDLVKCTGLLRGSLYATFGSKQGMFIAALKRSVATDSPAKWGLLIVAMLEVTSTNQKVAQLVHDWYQAQQTENIAEEIGRAVLAQGQLIDEGVNHGK
ncbi:MAG: TetR/AcrR family transcriptional regulator [Lactobacillus sp.]|nr:TetR/AcrR family transcriptional regulator [Lactobacillus sp.]MDN6043040.1 TetR/AcrR family transcriptional regulator [Lactobacillus sp.]MDN6052062.1 TetR/AcrR family transcriptional regulator [Lactobacillus sp.]